MLRQNLITRCFIKRPESLLLGHCTVSKTNTEIAKLMSDRYIHVAFVCVCVWEGGLQIKTVYITSEIWCMSFDDMN
jgi:hypothetical protein